MKKSILSVLVLCLFGCANGKITHDATMINENAKQSVEKLFVGIPVFASIEGSKVRIDDEWVVTVAHNKPILTLQMKEAYYHPTCDIALIHDPVKSSNHLKVNHAYINETIYHVGYPIGLPLAVNKGKVIGNVRMKEYPKCIVIATTGVVAQGMSGGAVINSNNELIGINWGYATSRIIWNNGTTLENGGIFVPLSYVQDWIYEITSKNYLPKLSE